MSNFLFSIINVKAIQSVYNAEFAMLEPDPDIVLCSV